MLLRVVGVEEEGKWAALKLEAEVRFADFS